jgi:hypothetical protein
MPVVDDETFVETGRTAVLLGIRVALESGFGTETPVPARTFPTALLDARTELTDLAELMETSLWR